MKEIIGEFSRLGKAVDTFADLKTEPTIKDCFGEVVLLNEIMENVG